MPRTEANAYFSALFGRDMSARCPDGVWVTGTALSEGRLRISLVCRDYPDPNRLMALEQELERFCEVSHALLSHRVEDETTAAGREAYIAALIPWLTRHLAALNVVSPIWSCHIDWSTDGTTLRLKTPHACSLLLAPATVPDIRAFLRRESAVPLDVELIPLVEVPAPGEGAPTSERARRSDAPAPTAGPAAEGGVTTTESSVTRRKKKTARARVRKATSPRRLIWGKSWSERFRPMPVREVSLEVQTVLIEGEVFLFEARHHEHGNSRVNFGVCDGTSSVSVALFTDRPAAEELEKKLKGARVMVRGTTQYNNYRHEIEVRATGLALLAPRPARKDEAAHKRVELHMHSMMSESDGIIDPAQLVSRAAEFGHSAVAITDHGVVQGFPAAFESARKMAEKGRPIKLIFGMEGYLVRDGRVLFRGMPEHPSDEEDTLADGFVALRVREDGSDLVVSLARTRDASETAEIETETRRFSPDPETRIAGLRRLSEWIGRRPLLVLDRDELALLRREGFAVPPGAPRAKFFTPYAIYADLCEAAKAKGEPDPSAATMAAQFRAYWSGLDTKRLRAANHAFGFVDFEDRRRAKARAFHIILLAENALGLYNLYRLVSLGLTEQFYRKPRMTVSQLEFFADGLITGAACVAGEIFSGVLRLYREHGQSYEKTKAALAESELPRLTARYDYLEIQPRTNNTFLTVATERRPDALREESLAELNRLVVDLGELTGTPVCATCDAHFLEPGDFVFRRVLAVKSTDGDDEQDAALFFRTTEEMLEEFAYLGEDKAFEVVVTNTNAVADRIDGSLRPFPEGSFPPIIDGADERLRRLTYEGARAVYGHDGVLPDWIERRIERELEAIIGNGFAVMYDIASKLVRRSNEDGYIVGSRGSVGSSLVATLTGITEVNPLPPHYVCPSCRYSERAEDPACGSGYDLPPKVCPVCGTALKGEGQNIPFETFLGFKGDKQPDIDLNFSGFYQARAHHFIETMFGPAYTFRAGTISAYAEKNSIGLVRSYFEKRGEQVPMIEVRRLAEKLVGVKQTTGQHPGGLVVVPRDYDIYDFTPVQYPPKTRDGSVITTHFDFNSMHDTLLKLDILGHDDPSMLKMLGDLTDTDVTTIPIPDPAVMALFDGVESLGLEPESEEDSATIGIPEMGTFIVRDMIRETRPKVYDNLVQLSGLSHGTGVWAGNAQELIRQGICDINDVIGCRDGIMTTLIRYHLPDKAAFDIMERVRKGRGMTPEQEALMREHEVPEWYIESCRRIQYMFPRAHAVAYTMSALRIAWYKVYYPEAYYAAWFTIRGRGDADQLLGDEETIRARLREQAGKDLRDNATDMRVFYTLELVLEMLRRGIHFLPISLEHSDATDYRVEGKGRLRPPLSILPGVSEKTALPIVKARAEAPFRTVDDLRLRAGAGASVIEELRRVGALDGLPESAQLDLFDMMA